MKQNEEVEDILQLYQKAMYYPSFPPSTQLSTHPSNYQFIHAIHPSICPSVQSSSPSTYLFHHLRIHPSPHLSMYPSNYPSTHHPFLSFIHLTKTQSGLLCARPTLASGDRGIRSRTCVRTSSRGKVSSGSREEQQELRA